MNAAVEHPPFHLRRLVPGGGFFLLGANLDDPTPPAAAVTGDVLAAVAGVERARAGHEGLPAVH